MPKKKSKTKEPRYTEAEWKQKQADEQTVASVYHATVGRRIKSIEVLRKILGEVLFPIVDPSIHEEVKELLKELSGPNTATISEVKIE